MPFSARALLPDPSLSHANPGNKPRSTIPCTPPAGRHPWAVGAPYRIPGKNRLKKTACRHCSFPCNRETPLWHLHRQSQNRVRPLPWAVNKQKKPPPCNRGRKHGPYRHRYHAAWSWRPLTFPSFQRPPATSYSCRQSPYRQSDWEEIHQPV